MRLKRRQQDMFGRPAAPVPAPARQRRANASGGRSIPPGLVPFLPVIGLIVALAAILVLPLVGVALLVVLVVGVVAVILHARYQQVKDIDYVQLRSSDPLWRSWNQLRRGVNRYVDEQRPPE